MNDYRGSAMNDYKMVVIFSAMFLKNEPVLSINQSIYFTTQHCITRFPYIYLYTIIILAPFTIQLFVELYIKKRKYCCAEG